MPSAITDDKLSDEDTINILTYIQTLNDLTVYGYNDKSKKQAIKSIGFVVLGCVTSFAISQLVSL